MRICYGCKYLAQGGSGYNACMKYDPDENGGIMLDDKPEPLYEDCYTASLEAA